MPAIIQGPVLMPAAKTALPLGSLPSPAQVHAAQVHGAQGKQTGMAVGKEEEVKKPKRIKIRI